jgi:peptidoglycan/LPS O-acetylase OafA/YrhL
MLKAATSSSGTHDMSRRSGGRGVSIAERMAHTGGRTSGFDYMRIILALSVVCVHSVTVSYGHAGDLAFWATPARPYLRAILPMFFALSGFLVAGSLERSKTLGMFLGLRAIRIYPALSVEVALSALLIGPTLTTTPLADYFSSPVFARYLLNVTGDIHYELPGLFAANPCPSTVNAQLWTVPFELYCYVAIAILALLGLTRRRWLAPTGAALIAAAHLGSRLIRDRGHVETVVLNLPGSLLVVSFLAGVAVYLYREKLPWSPAWAIASAAASAALVGFVPAGDYLAPFTLAYLVACLGLCDPRRVRLIAGADYSYGVFLYGFVVQQSFASLGAWTHHWWLNLLVCIPLSAVFAAASWRLVEKPALRLRSVLVRAETWWLARRPLPRGAVRSA